MHGLMLDLIGTASGLAVYAVMRAPCSRHAVQRRSEQRNRLDGLLAPYATLAVRPIPVRDELPSNVRRLHPRPRD